MEKFSYRCGAVTLQFGVSEEGCPCLLYAGTHPAARREEEALGRYAAEVQLSGENHGEHHFSKHYRSSETPSLRYAGHRVQAHADGEELIVTSRNSRITAESHYRFFRGAEGFRAYTVVVNSGNSPVILDYVSAFSYVGIDAPQAGNWQEDAFVWIPHNAWKAECSWQRYPVKDLGLFCCAPFSAKRIALTDTGTWSTKEYLPAGIFGQAGTGELLFWEIEGTLSWEWEISTVHSRLYLLAGGANLQESFWQKSLAPGESYRTPEVFVTFGGDLDELFARVTDYRRVSRTYDESAFGLAPVFNDYMNCLDTDPSTEKELPLIECAQRLGCKYYMIDAGWYTDGFWWDDTGEWRAAPTRFRGGLAFVLEEIRRRGMIPGLWVEIEVMSEALPFANALPDGWFFRRNGRRVRDNGRYLLDFSVPAVRAFADGVMDRLIGEYGAGYIKMDHNVNGGVGTESGFSPGEGLENHWRAFNRWIAGVMKRHPHVIFENCASGGCRMEYGLLRKYHLQSTSDQTHYADYVSIAANCVTAVTPEQAGVWTYPVAEDDTEAVVFNMVNAILLHVYQSGRVDLLDERRFSLVREGISVNQALSEVILKGHAFWPLGLARFDDPYSAFGIARGDEMYLCFWNKDNLSDAVVPLQKYGVRAVEQVYPSQIETNMRLEGDNLLIFPHRKFFARLFRLKK